MESTLPSFCWSHKIQDEEAVLKVLAVMAVMAVSVVTATPLNSTPPFRHPDRNPNFVRTESSSESL